jgi:hypothetical protein
VEDLSTTAEPNKFIPVNKLYISKAVQTKMIKSKLTLIKDSPFTVEQILKIMQRTPKNHIYQRPAKGGGVWDYVTGTYVKKVLNYTFGFMWSTEIKNIQEKHNQIQATVRLTIHRPSGEALLWKEDIGKKDFAFRKGTEIPLDYGNDEKSAVTDGIKRCAAQFGIASDIYGKEEFKEIQLEKMISEDTAKKEIPVGEKDAELATPAQLSVIKTLKGEVKEGMTQADAKVMIAELTSKK